MIDDIRWPPHLGGMLIEKDPHRCNYETVAQWSERAGYSDWVSDEERDKAIAQDSFWTLQWYPLTPIGFCCVAAATLSACLEAATGDGAC